MSAASRVDCPVPLRIDPEAFASQLARHWARASFFEPNALREPLFPPELVFDAYKACAAADHHSFAHVRFYRRQTDSASTANWEDFGGGDAVRFLPNAEDKSIDAYFRRIESEHGTREFAVQLRYNLASYSPELWRIARAFLHRAFDATGFPAGGWNLDCYLGKYQATPFGVHRDPEDQFYFVSLGKKRLHLWTEGEWRVDDGADYRHAFRSHPGSRRTHVVSPNDLLYWPRETWHVGESSGPSVSVQINIFRGARERTLRDIYDAIETILDRVVPTDESDFWWESARPADVLQRRCPDHLPTSKLADLVRELVSDGSLHRELAARRLRRLAAWYSLDEKSQPFSMRPDGKRAGDRVRLRSGMALLWSERIDDLLLATNGHRFSVPKDATVAHALERLSAGTWVSCAELLELEAAGDATASGDLIGKLVDILVSHGALEYG